MLEFARTSSDRQHQPDRYHQLVKIILKFHLYTVYTFNLILLLDVMDSTVQSQASDRSTSCGKASLVAGFHVDRQSQILAWYKILGNKFSPQTTKPLS
jgi:hypothetical protein